ncbi:hypothetical protein GN956_G14413 [Arapaima gigas]
MPCTANIFQKVKQTWECSHRGVSLSEYRGCEPRENNSQCQGVGGESRILCSDKGKTMKGPSPGGPGSDTDGMTTGGKTSEHTVQTSPAERTEQ